MTAWWSDNHPRLKQEKAAIAQLVDQESWLENVEWSLDDQLRLQVVFDIRIEQSVFNLVMTYHNTFPHSPPSVAPVEEGRLSSHQYLNGDLCLDIRPDNWRQEFAGADLIRSSRALLLTEAPDENGQVQPAPSAHNVPDTIESRSALLRFYVTSEDLQVLLKDAPGYSSIKLLAQWSRKTVEVVFLSSVAKDDWSWDSRSIPASVNKESFPYTGLLMKSSNNSSDFNGINSSDELFTLLKLSEDPSDDHKYLVLTTKDSQIIMFYRQNNKKLLRVKPIYSPSFSYRRIDEDFYNIADKRVGIVGLGSLGSKVAVSLARTGVKKFELIDDDILHPENLERHDLDWRDIGIHKVDAISRRMSLISQDIEIVERKTFIGAQVSTTEAANVNAALRNCDIIIDATANPHVFNHLSGLVHGEKNSLIWGGVYAGGIGGFIARSIFEKDPDPFMIREALNMYYESINVPPPMPDLDGYDGRNEDEVLIASDADVSVIASHLSNFALDALLEREPSHFEHHAYIIGLKRAWSFEKAFEVHPIETDAPIRSSLPQLESDPVEIEFVDKLVKKKLDEIESRKKDN